MGRRADTLKRCLRHVASYGLSETITHRRLAMEEKERECGEARLPCAVPPVNPEVSAGHEAAGVADQKHGRASVLVRKAQLAEHVLRRPISPAFRELLEELLDHGGDNVARRDGVDADAMLAPLGGEVAGELDDTGF